MRKLGFVFILYFLSFSSTLHAQVNYNQGVFIEGYAFETGDRGFLNLVSIKVYDLSNQLIASTASDMSGIFQLDLPPGQEFILTAYKDIFKEKKVSLSTVGKSQGEKLYLKLEMERQPGYLFDVTMAQARTKKQVKNEVPADAVQGARIEVYNNTKEKQVMDLVDYPNPNFKVHFEDGNHYTIMIRKKGLYTKRMEAYVNVEGCILCFDGIGEVKPGVSDVLTESNSMGTLLANVTLKPVEVGKAIKVENIYYDLNSYKIRKDAEEELDKLVTVLKDNPTLLLELGSHTDSRGDIKSNQRLSQKRAEAAVRYITQIGSIENWRIKAKGYGESKLVNRCKDGVECSERKHQQNRRTEIKVTGVLADDPYDKYSLAQIIEREKGDALLEAILNNEAEVIELKPGEELPEEIAKEIEAQNAARKNKTTVTTPEVEVIEVIESAEAIEPADIVSGKPDSEPKPEKNMMISDTSKKPVLRKPVSETKILNELEVNVDTKPTMPSVITSGFNGYMVEFYTSVLELPANHEIFTKHGKIYKEIKKDGTFAYMFGPFNEMQDAQRFLDSTVSKEYQSVDVIRYRNGRRSEK